MSTCALIADSRSPSRVPDLLKVSLNPAGKGVFMGVSEGVEVSVGVGSSEDPRKRKNAMTAIARTRTPTMYQIILCPPPESSCGTFTEDEGGREGGVLIRGEGGGGTEMRPEGDGAGGSVMPAGRPGTLPRSCSIVRIEERNEGAGAVCVGAGDGVGMDAGRVGGTPEGGVDGFGMLIGLGAVGAD